MWGKSNSRNKFYFFSNENFLALKISILQTISYQNLQHNLANGHVNNIFGCQQKGIHMVRHCHRAALDTVVLCRNLDHHLAQTFPQFLLHTLHGSRFSGNVNM
jgi:hypothetical protein